MPVSLERVQELTGKSVTFLEADLRFHSDDDCACCACDACIPCSKFI